MRQRLALLLVGWAWAAGGAPLAAADEAAPDPRDWVYWRGPEQNGVSREKNLPDKIKAGGPDLLWKSDKLGTRSTPIIMKGRLYLLARHLPETPREAEKVVCADAATGEVKWENVFNIYLTDVPDTRVAWSSVVGDPTNDKIYALGVGGFFQCIDANTGKTVWSRSMSEEFGLLSTYGGRTNYPIVYEDLVIVNGVMIGWGENARPNHRYIAFDKTNGQVAWFNSTRPLPDDTTYSAPVIANIEGVPLLIAGSGDGFLHAMQPRTGKIVWKYALSRRGVNNTPLVVGNTVYAGQSEENVGESSMGAVVALDARGKGDITKSDKVLWNNKKWMVGRAAPVLADDKLVLIDDGGTVLFADPKTGKALPSNNAKKGGDKPQKLGTFIRSSPLYADGRIYEGEVNGKFWVFKPTKNGLEVVDRITVPGEVHASPIAAHGRLYLTSTDVMYCYAKKGATPAADPIPPAAPEMPVEDKQPAQLAVVPAEVLAKPGEKITFATRSYNAAGQRLPDQDVQFTVKGGGSIDANGLLTLPEAAKHTAVYVTAEASGVKGTANVRVVPDLPWSFDFNDGQIPLPWIGMRYRHVIRDVGGEKVMCKITTIPKGQRSQAWIGHPGLSDYTIQADVRGSLKNGKLPDVGLIAQRYTLDMMGASQQLQIRSWVPMPKLAVNKPFAWKQDVWYTMKFRAETGNGKATLRGKVWLRGEQEPAEWTITAVSDSPNNNGSPGFFGNAQVAEIFIDNVSVYKNYDQASDAGAGGNKK